MKTFLLRAKHFIKRNIYPITVTMCTVLVLAIIAVSAYSAIKSNNEEISINTNGPVENGGQNIGDSENDNSGDPDDEKEANTPETIIFDLPFDSAKITKQYAENGLLYDSTTDYWRSHQGIDFACNEGQVVKAVYGGVISKIENTMMQGIVVHLKITDELEVVYRGLSSSIKVKEGDKVTKGQELGTVSIMMSEKKDGIHLHLEMTKSGVLIDPTEYFAFNK